MAKQQKVWAGVKWYIEKIVSITRQIFSQWEEGTGVPGHVI